MGTANKTEIIRADAQHRESIISLLQNEKLPVKDLPDILSYFLVARDNDKVVGVIGLEQYENYGLLRSMAVDTSHRNQSIATQLVKRLENLCTEKNISCIYLLTETAADFFRKKNYETIKREEVPEAIKASSEFSSVCPVSATVMRKML